MAKNRIQTVFEGDSADLIQDVQKIGVKLDQLEDKYKQIGKATKQVTAEEKKLAREAKRVFDDTRTPMERHIQQKQRLNEMLKKQKISQETYNRAVRNSQNELRGAGRAGQQAFGPQALGQLKSMVMGYLSVGAAIGAATMALREMNQVREEAAQKQRESGLSAGALAQLGAKGFQGRREAARSIYRGGGAVSMSEANRIAFQLESSKSLAQAPFMSRLAIIGGEEGVAGMSESAGRLVSAMGAEETGTHRQILAKAAIAARPVVGAGIKDILQATAQAAGSATPLGLSDEEIMAAVSQTAKVFTPKESATAVARMFDKMAAKGYGDKYGNLREMLAAARAETPTAKKALSFMGVRGIKAFRQLPDKAYADTLAQIQGGDESAIMELIGAAERDPELAGYQDWRKGTARLELSKRAMALKKTRLDASRMQWQSAAQERGWETVAWGVGAGAKAAEYGEHVVGTMAPAMRYATGGVREFGIDVGAVLLKEAASALLQVVNEWGTANRQRPVQQKN